MFNEINITPLNSYIKIENGNLEIIKIENKLFTKSIYKNYSDLLYATEIKNDLLSIRP